MTLHEKVCQLFVVQPVDLLPGLGRVTEAGAATRDALERYPVAGLLYDAGNLVTVEQTRSMLVNAQSFSKIPLILTCDEEGGRVNRLMHTIGTTYVGPMLDYKDQGAETAAANARTIAADLVSCGFNMDFAPVADVWSNPSNTVIGDRAYSDDFQQAALLAFTRAARPAASSTSPVTGTPPPTATTARCMSTKPWTSCARRSFSPSRRASRPGRTR